MQSLEYSRFLRRGEVGNRVEDSRSVYISHTYTFLKSGCRATTELRSVITSAVKI